MINNVITIAICTYKRPILLQKCIESILVQLTDYEFEIIVIDNDVKKTAQEIVKKFNDKIQYFVQPSKGLSHARNMAVSKASGRFVLFIDDDEYADESWINNMMDCQKKI